MLAFHEERFSCRARNRMPDAFQLGQLLIGDERQALFV